MFLANRRQRSSWLSLLKGCDFAASDGIYSAFFIDLSGGDGKYSVEIKVSNENGGANAVQNAPPGSPAYSPALVIGEFVSTPCLSRSTFLPLTGHPKAMSMYMYITVYGYCNWRVNNVTIVCLFSPEWRNRPTVNTTTGTSRSSSLSWFLWGQWSTSWPQHWPVPSSQGHGPSCHRGPSVR